MNAKTLDEFTFHAHAEGFDEALERRWEPGTVLDTHTHAFDARAEVMQGEMWLTVGGKTLYRTIGDTFAVSRLVPHSERYGPDGATVWVARRNA